MTTAFDKMQSHGNDFVLLDLRQFCSSYVVSRDIIARISHRIFGIGCDGVVLYKKSQCKDLSSMPLTLVDVRFFNADGSMAEICGNALRCLGLLVHIRHGVSQCTALTRNCKQRHLLTVNDADNITVTGEKPSFSAGDIGLTKSVKNPLQLDVICDLQLIDNALVPTVLQDCLKVACISVGNPHLVFFLKKLPSTKQAKTIGEQLMANPLFKNGVNVSFAHIIDELTTTTLEKNLPIPAAPAVIESITYERGVGLTMACGSGASAVAILAQQCRMIQSSLVLVHQRGGSLRIDINNQDGSYAHTGAAVHVFSGNIDL
ncbi:MAG: diaminopimelate epimerase [Holosporaceae bacterium]|jgi:diaminopimelate epimerase|nr:diaminopimelate epimerase [Holosporaceae bacterium]